VIPKPAAVNRPGRWFARAAFYAHLWLGVLFTIALLSISITGVLLNHKRGLGLMPDVDHEPAGEFTAALPLAYLADRASAATTPAIAQALVAIWFSMIPPEAWSPFDRLRGLGGFYSMLIGGIAGAIAACAGLLASGRKKEDWL